MQIDLKQLASKNIISIDEDVIISEDLFIDTNIKNLKNLHLKGQIIASLENELELNLQLTGVMVLEDAYSLELVDYPFTSQIEESIGEDSLKKSQNSENTLDITEILWQNIVLEVPISYSKSKRVDALSGDGWELRDENTKKIDSRFAKLTELLEKGKE